MTLLLKLVTSLPMAEQTCPKLRAPSIFESHLLKTGISASDAHLFALSC
jgi:hypothetical protein